MKTKIWTIIAGLTLVGSAITLTTTHSFAQQGRPGPIQPGAAAGQPGQPGQFQGGPRFQGGGGGGAAIAVDGSSLYVVANGKVYVMDKSSLKITKEAELPMPRPQGGGGFGPGGGAGGPGGRPGGAGGPGGPGGPGEEAKTDK